ncbi:hypothetical protein [Sphingomonas elodea]|uniref:hypothetical protein n=1 Tax=Sphingomonas elodea TaxID=179878 RepID=UPI0002630D28|nr:hypothetical protein [Sphingomonas elodea]
MLKSLLLSIALCAPGLASATTVRVENRSDITLKLHVEHARADIKRHLRPTLSPHTSTFVRQVGGKVLAPRDEANGHLVDIVVTDATGRGCRFRTVAERHSDAMVLIVPVAAPVGAGHCEARTGRTIGDFVFIAF